ncbi:ROK family transcriptional regulator [Kineosporia sp. R_H_3]|uniref:ROK family transcriptional regulator n=1 Tax=Kineosporia sp. R_H_3 TaxID=1961848 RepID=UPI000B4AB403|nr:ROK family transcriptional regulator [Kineosporia sp. R_H_3]
MREDRGQPAGRPRLLRTLNDRLALEVLLDSGPLTRQQISDLTGLSRPTASLMLCRLEAVGLVAPTGDSTPAGRGPHAALYGVPPRTVLSAAVDVARDTSRVEVLDVTGRTVAAATLPTCARTPAARTLRDLLAAVCPSAGIAATDLAHVVVGIGSAYDGRTDRLANAEHLPGWAGPALSRTLSRRLGVTVVVENDANLALVGEQAADPEAVRDGTVLLWFGDGVGLAVEVGGVVHRGATGRAGEIGYVRARPPQGDGRRDLQAVLGGAGLESLAAGYALTAGPDGLTEAVVLARSEERGRGARAFLADVTALVTDALEPVIGVLDPALVVLGGPGGASGGAMLADLVEADLRARGRWFGHVRGPRSGPDAVLAGGRTVATRLARDLLLERVGRATEQVAT